MNKYDSWFQQLRNKFSPIIIITTNENVHFKILSKENKQDEEQLVPKKLINTTYVINVLLNILTSCLEMYGSYMKEMNQNFNYKPHKPCSKQRNKNMIRQKKLRSVKQDR